MYAFVKPCAKTENGSEFVEDMEKFKTKIIEIEKVDCPDDFYQYEDIHEEWSWSSRWLVILDTPELLEEYKKISEGMYE